MSRGGHVLVFALKTVKQLSNKLVMLKWYLMTVYIPVAVPVFFFNGLFGKT
jgi:hypothetical protein